MKVIIAGGRNTHVSLREMDNEIRESNFPITEVVSGGASGIDMMGEVWAYQNHIPVVKYTAQWDKHGRAAGPIRNIEMSLYADALIAFPGGAGTSDIIKQMKKLGKDVYLAMQDSHNTFTPDWTSQPHDTIVDILEERGWSEETLGEKMGLTPKKTHDLITGKLPITPEIAAKLELALGGTSSFWVNREKHIIA